MLRRRGAPLDMDGGSAYLRGRRATVEDEDRSPQMASSMVNREAKFMIGQVVRHRIHPFRGVVFDVDPEFSNSDEWWEAIPEENRPHKDQPFYHLLAENETSYYHAYVSEQNLLPDETGDPVDHPQVGELFGDLEGGRYEVATILTH